MANNITVPAFMPKPASTVSVSAATGSSSVQFQTGNLCRHVRVVNTGTSVVFVEFGDSAPTATTASSMPVPGNSVAIFAAPLQFAAGISASTTGQVVYFTPGEGGF